MTMTLEQALSTNEFLRSQNQELTAKLKSTQRQLVMLQHQVEQLLRRVYGRRSEKMDPRQLMFDSLLLDSSAEQHSLPDTPDEPPLSPAQKKSRKATRRHPGRIPIPEHLERVEIVLDVPEQEKVCPETGEPLVHIGDEISEKIEYRPSKFIVNVYRRPKYAAPDNHEGSVPDIITAPMPEHPIAKCKADIGLLSHMLVSKFCDHLPIYRQQAIYEREGIYIPQPTLNGWCMQIYEAVSPLEPVLKEAILSSKVIFTDDTPIKLQVKGNGKTKTARLWVYVRGGPDPALVAFDFSKDRSKKRPLAYLDTYQGYVHADAYSGYDELFGKDGIIEVGCWVHARRKFDEAVSSRPEEATEMLARIGLLYKKVERECAHMEPDERYRFRKQYARPVLDGIFKRLEELKAETIPSEPLRKAVDYALNQRDALCRYLENGWLKPDNNVAENAIRPVAVGRKNWLFAGSERGGRAAALFFSLTQSCKACGVNPWEYFDDMLRRIMNHPVTRLRELLPDQWKPLPKDEHGLLVETA